MIDNLRRGVGRAEIGAGISDERAAAGWAGVCICLPGKADMALPAEFVIGCVHTLRVHRRVC
jgi:hypothetical protein